MPASDDLANLKDWIGSRIGKSPNALRLTPSSTGKYNTTWLVDSDDTAYVLRVAPPDDPQCHLFYEYRMMRREPGIHALLERHTSIPVPRVVAHGEQVAPMNRDLILLERLPGTPLSETPVTADQLDAILESVGRCLREVHHIQGRAFGYPTYTDSEGRARGPMTQRSSWPEAFATMWDQLIADIESCGGYEAHEGQLMRQLLSRFSEVFPPTEAPCLLHMDVWAENLLVDEKGNLTGIVDWDRALWGDPEIEFAVLDYCGISEPAFWKGYGRADPREEAPHAQVRRLFYLLYEVQKYIFIQLARDQNPNAAQASKEQAFRLAKKLM